MAWHTSNRGREKLLPEVPESTLLLSNLSLSLQTRPFLPSLFCITILPLSLSFLVTGYLHIISYSPTSHDTFSTPLGLVPAHPAQVDPPSSLPDELLSTLELPDILRSTIHLVSTRKRTAERRSESRSCLLL